MSPLTAADFGGVTAISSLPAATEAVIKASDQPSVQWTASQWWMPLTIRAAYAHRARGLPQAFDARADFHQVADVKPFGLAKQKLILHVHPPDDPRLRSPESPGVWALGI